MKKTLALFLAAASLALAGCGSNDVAPPSGREDAPRPAPGTQTKDVMVPAAK